MKKNIFNLVKLVTSRMLYLFLGIGLGLGIYAAQALWSWSVNSTDNLTVVKWNELKDKIIDLSNGNLSNGINFTAGFPTLEGNMARTGQVNCPNGQFMCGLNRDKDDNWDYKQIVCCKFKP